MKRGFTLIELSIVLVIIGLIVGGVLVGKDLIKAAEIRSLVAEYGEIRTSINTFRAKYNSMPGDLTTQQATSFGMQPATRNAPVANGHQIVHGDGKISTCADQYDFIGSEGVLFWRDLSSAGLIRQNFTTATDIVESGLTVADLPLYLPVSKIRSAYWIATAANSCGFIYNAASLSEKMGVNYFYLGSTAIDSGSYYNVTNEGLTPLESFQMDSKLDDGDPWGGNIRVNMNMLSSMVARLVQDNMYNYVDVNAPHCSTLGDGYDPIGQPTTKYRVDTYPNNKVCNLNLPM